LIGIVKNDRKTRAMIDEVIGEVVKSGGIAYATQRMTEYRDQALQRLREFPESDIRNALEDLVRYSIDRKK
jgi:octaprenyl-diphosphate synthase